MKSGIIKIGFSILGAWLVYLLVSFLLLECFVSHRNISFEFEINSESEQEIVFSYNILPFQAGAIPYYRSVKKGTNTVAIPFVNDLEIRRIYLTSNAPIKLAIKSFTIDNSLINIELPLSLLADNISLYASGGNNKLAVNVIDDGIDINLTKTHSKLVISKTILDIIYEQLIGIYYKIAQAVAIICLLFLLFYTFSYKEISTDQLFVFTFISIIFTPFLSQKDNYTSENRQLAPFPDLNVNIWRIPKSFNAYYNDHFPFRNTLRNMGNHIKYDIFNTSPKPDLVQINKDGWLFYSSKDIRSVYQGTHLYTEEQLKQIKENLETRARLLAKEGITYYFVLAPLKHQVYPEHLPKGFEIVGSTTKREQVINYLKANSSINLIDPHQALIDLKNKYTVYYKTDTHWNRMGAFHVYQQIINRIRQDYPSISPALELEDFEISRKVDYTGDLVSLLDMENTFSREPYYFTPKFTSNYTSEEVGAKMEGEISFLFYNTNQKDKPRMVLYRDSFGEYLRPYLAEHFSYSGIVWCRQLSRERILKEKPDILIQETMERFIDDLLIN